MLSTTTHARLEKMAPARLVVGIPSYRNPDTIQSVTAAVAHGLAAHYRALDPVIVHVDGHSFDNTLDLAAATPLPAGVRRFTTRYQGLPGKGSAVQSCFTVADRLGAEIVVLVEADTLSMDAAALQRLVTPLLEGRADAVWPRYPAIVPRRAGADLLLHPLARALFEVPVAQPTAGELALSGNCMRFLLACDVWESDVARAGVDIWMAARLAIQGARLAEVPLPAKQHRATPGDPAIKFAQAAGTLLRMAYLHERAWLARAPHPWPETRPAPRAVQRLLEGWVHTVYGTLLDVTFGDGDPERVVTALYQQLDGVVDELERLSHGEEADAWAAATASGGALFLEQLPRLKQAWQRQLAPL